MFTTQVSNPHLVIERDLARIRQCWQEHKKASPRADAFSFLARIAATGKIRMRLDSRRRRST